MGIDAELMSREVLMITIGIRCTRATDNYMFVAL